MVSEETQAARLRVNIAASQQQGTLMTQRKFTVLMIVGLLAVDQIAVSELYKERLDLDQDGRPDAAADPDGKSEGFVAILDNGPADRAHGRMTLS